MKRILGTVAAIAGVLAFSTAAMATTVVFDVSGDIGYWTRSTDPNASNPMTAGGACPTGIDPGPGGGCFRFAFSAGSSLSVDITGSSVTLLGGTLNLSTVAVLQGGLINISSSSTTLVAGGAVGTLTGNDILWSTTTTQTQTAYPSSWIMCTGAGCAVAGWPGIYVGVPIPIQPILSSLSNAMPTAVFDPGLWHLNATNDDIVSSTLVTASWGNILEEENRRHSAYSFGQSVPEPGSAALVLLGLGALALRSRKA